MYPGGTKRPEVSKTLDLSDKTIATNADEGVKIVPVDIDGVDGTIEEGTNI